MQILFESDRECTIDGVGLLVPGQPVEVDPVVFAQYHQVTPAQANFPPYIKVTYTVESEPEGGE